MHNRLGPGAESCEMSRADFGLIAPLIAVIVFLGVYPQFVLERSEKSTVSQLHPEISVIGQTHQGWTCYAPVTAGNNAGVPGCPP
jgi:hypothetical protein